MKNYFKILWLRMSIGKLKRKRKQAILDISVYQSKEANRAATIEDVNPSYFRRVDGEISSKERLVTILAKKSIKSLESISESKP